MASEPGDSVFHGKHSRLKHVQAKLDSSIGACWQVECAFTHVAFAMKRNETSSRDGAVVAQDPSDQGCGHVACMPFIADPAAAIATSLALAPSVLFAPLSSLRNNLPPLDASSAKGLPPQGQTLNTARSSGSNAAAAGAAAAGQPAHASALAEINMLKSEIAGKGGSRMACVILAHASA